MDNENLSAANKDECTWGLLAHLSALVGFIIPFGSIVGPLVVWLVKKETMPFVADQAKEALNFQITMFIGFIICFILTFVLIGLILLPILAIADLVLIIMAALKAQKGEQYRYPFALRLVK